MTNDGIPFIALIKAVKDSPTGELTLGARKQLWAVLGPRNLFFASHTISTAHRARLLVAKACLDCGLDAWNTVYPQNTQISAFLANYNHNLGNPQCIESMRMWERRLSSLSEQLEDKHPNPVNFVALAAADLAGAAYRDHLFDTAGCPEIDDGLVDSQEWDTSFSISIVLANGAPWNLESDVEARRKYWTWYLETAVPSAVKLAMNGEFP